MYSKEEGRIERRRWEYNKIRNRRMWKSNDLTFSSCLSCFHSLSLSFFLFLLFFCLWFTPVPPSFFPFSSFTFSLSSSFFTFLLFFPISNSPFLPSTSSSFPLSPPFLPFSLISFFSYFIFLFPLFFPSSFHVFSSFFFYLSFIFYFISF